MTDHYVIVTVNSKEAAESIKKDLKKANPFLLDTSIKIHEVPQIRRLNEIIEDVEAGKLKL
jgi:hypothetical protein